MCERYVGLVRVSTDKQADTRLGLDAGIKDLKDYVEARGAVLVDLIEEVESGGHDCLMDRPKLLKALTLCKRHKAVLLIPKVDRLVRSTMVHTDIKRSGVAFRCVDMPEANEFTLDILVAVAAHERRMISARTKAALAVYKARGGKLGADLVGSHLTDEDRRKGSVKANGKRRQDSIDAYADLVPEMKAWRDSGLSLRAIADRLNAEGHTTRNGAAWSQVQVKRLLDRAV